MVGFEQLQGGKEVFLAHSDPVHFELNRLQNQLKEKDRELGVAYAEIKSLRATEVLKVKAVEELKNELDKLDKKLGVTENAVEQRNLEIKKLANEKKDALAAQFAAEAALRRLHANQRDNDSFSVESIIAPLEADIKIYKNEIAALQEDNKALERLTKSKESSLIEAERILRSALERALIVEEIQNHNFELKRQIEIYQEENRILDKTYRHKVLEVEKLSKTIQELEEAILAGGAAANTIRDYQRQICGLHEEKRTLERELARVKVSANRVATVVANEWKDDNDKVMPIKQWLEERRLLQAEMQRLRDKLAVSERTAKAEAQLKDKLKLRLKTLEEGLQHVSSFSVNSNASSMSPKTEKANHILGFLSNNSVQRKRSSSQPRASAISRSTPLQQPSVENETARAAGELKRVSSLKKKYASGENMLRKNLWASRTKVADSGEKENTELKTNTDSNISKFRDDDKAVPEEIRSIGSGGLEEIQIKVSGNTEGEDIVSGFLYDRLQREVISLRKSCEVKESSLNSREEEIKMLMKKVDALTKAIEVESRRVKREAAAREKEATPAKIDDSKNIRNTSFLKSKIAKAS